jgi:hypothetical protein
VIQRKIVQRAVAAAACLAVSSAPAAPLATGQPALFAPGVISGPSGVDCATFSPDGNTVYFDQQAGHDIMIMMSQRVAGTWTTPVIAPFSGRWIDHDPWLAPDASFLVLTSNRPDTAGAQPLHGGHLWRINRVDGHWGEPIRLPDSVNATRLTFAPSVAADGSVYYQQRSPTPGSQFHLYRSAYRDGHYQAPVLQKLGPADAHEQDPAIAPDQSFIVFDADYAGKDQPDRLYIAFRENDHWGRPIDLGDAVNDYQPWGSHLGPDARTLYFTSGHTMKVSYPRTPAEAQADLARMRAWDNGNNHIWSISLAPWLDAHRKATADTTPPSPRGELQ